MKKWAKDAQQVSDGARNGTLISDPEPALSLLHVVTFTFTAGTTLDLLENK